MQNLIITTEDGRRTQNQDLRRLMGLNPKRLPPSGALDKLSFTVQGIHLMVDPQVPGKRKHRVKAMCPRCAKIVSAGRLGQHAAMHQRADALEAIEEGRYYVTVRQERPWPITECGVGFLTMAGGLHCGSELAQSDQRSSVVMCRDRAKGDFPVARVHVTFDRDKYNAQQLRERSFAFHRSCYVISEEVLGV